MVQSPDRRKLRYGAPRGGTKRSVPLQTLSPVVDGLIKVNQRRLYVPEINRQAAEDAVRCKTAK